MKKEDCCLGMKVKMLYRAYNGRTLGMKYGKVIKKYENYAVIRINTGYNEGYFYPEIQKDEGFEE